MDHEDLGLAADNMLEHVFMMDDDSYLNVPKLYQALYGLDVSCMYINS